MSRKFWLAVIAAVLMLPVMGVPSAAHAQNCLNVVDSGECKFGLPAGEYDALFGVMQANPAPGVQPLGVDDGELSRFSFWRLANDSITFYDAPNGNPVGTIDPGFNFTGILRREGDWVEIAPNHWIPSSDLAGVRASSYSGVMVPGGLPLQMAWMVKFVRPSQVPGGRAAGGTPILQRYTRVFIYKAVQVGRWEWYLIGPGQWVEQRNVARMQTTGVPGGVGGRWVAVDLYEQVLVAYDGGSPVFATLISSGVRSTPTRLGVFSVWARKTTDAMTGAMGGPRYYALPSVPYVQYFDKDISLHGTYWHDDFGLQRSRGCVNLSVTDARWLFDFLGEAGSVYVWRSR
jgi:L,D-transpeptidase catalytic domain